MIVSLVHSVAAAKRVVRRRSHRIQNCPLHVQLLPDSESSNMEDDDEPGYDQDASSSVTIIIAITLLSMSFPILVQRVACPSLPVEPFHDNQVVLGTHDLIG